MFRFTDYAFEIFTLGTVKGVDVGVAFSMFHMDIVSGNNTNCGDAVDRDTLDEAHDAFKASTVDEQADAVDEWHDFIGECYSDACDTLAQGADAVAALVAEWRSDRENN